MVWGTHVLGHTQMDQRVFPKSTKYFQMEAQLQACSSVDKFLATRSFGCLKQPTQSSRTGVFPKKRSFLPRKFRTNEFHSDTLFRIIASEQPPPFHRSLCALHMALGGRKLTVGYLKSGQKLPKVCRTHDANVRQLHGTNTQTTPDVYFLESQK